MTEKVPPDLYRVIEQAVQFSRLSDGKFDISIAPLVNLWKAALRGEGTPSQEKEDQVRSCVGYEKIQLIPRTELLFAHPACSWILAPSAKAMP